MLQLVAFFSFCRLSSCMIFLTNCNVMNIRVMLIFPAFFFLFTCMLSLSIKEMEAEVNRGLRRGNHEVLSEGFGLSLTRKDLQTLSNLNWLNDEVSTH